MSVALYMIDGWGKPQKAPWNALKLALETLLGVEAYTRDRNNISVGELLAEHRPIILIGHSFGGWKAARLTQEFHQAGGEIPVAVIVDGVWEDPAWNREALECKASHNMSIRRIYRDRGAFQVLTPWSPPSVDIIGGPSHQMQGTHTSIIAAATPSIVEFVRKAVAA